MICAKLIENSVQRLDGIERRWMDNPGRAKKKTDYDNCHLNTKYTVDCSNTAKISLIMLVSFFENCNSRDANDFFWQFDWKTIRVVEGLNLKTDSNKNFNKNKKKFSHFTRNEYLW